MILPTASKASALPHSGNILVMNHSLLQNMFVSRFAVNQVALMGQRITIVVQSIGAFMLFVKHVFTQVFAPPFRGRLIVQQMDFIGNQSLNIVVMSAFFVGAVFGLQIGIVFKIFMAEGIMGAATGKALARELAPMMTGFLISGRAGSAMTAELATMRVTEQIDAMEAMGVDPVSYLVVPRLIAGLLIVPILCGIFMFVGVFGAYVMGVVLFNVDQGVFFDKIVSIVRVQDVVDGLQKSVIFSFVITLLACQFGLRAGGGAKGVGSATTNSVVTTFLILLGFDFLITYIQIVL